MDLQTNVKTGDVKISSPEGATAPVEKKPEPDLITRVSQVKVEPKVEPTEIKEPEFDYKEIEAIQDPTAKAQALAAYKSFQKGFNQKFQEIAELRKTLEKQVVKPEPPNWTPERVQELTKDPTFIAAAQSIVGTKEDDTSMLSTQEKAKIQEMDNELKNLRQQSYRAYKVQQDEVLKGKYANFKPEAVDTITNDLLTGKIQANREYIWKAYDYEDAVQRAYNLGLKDRNLDEKVNAISIEGLAIKGTDTPIQRNEGESNSSLWRRIAERNLSKLVNTKK